MHRQFPLKRVFVAVGVLAILFALVGFIVRPKPGRIPEAMMMQQVDAVESGMRLDEVVLGFGFDPSSSWLNNDGSGYAVWRFEVSDVEYSHRRASYFVKFENRKMKSGFLLYPVESAGGGMVF